MITQRTSLTNQINLSNQFLIKSLATFQIIFLLFFKIIFYNYAKDYAVRS